MDLAGSRGAPALALGLMLASGFAGLGYQIVWTQQSATWLGHEAAAVLAVVGAFFGGLALGAFALGDRIERSPRPWRWYAGCELVIAAWSAALALLLGPIGAALLALIGAEAGGLRQWSVSLAGTFLVLLPATAAMGATLPAMHRVATGWVDRGRGLAALYACNTLGAVVGVLATAFWLIPAFGLVRTAALCALLNVACAVAVLALARPTDARVPAAAPTDPRPLLRLAAAGCLGIGYEVVVVRVLGQVAEDTVYTFALLLAVYLVGTAAGAAFHARRPPVGPVEVVRARLLTVQAAACLVGASTLWWAADTLEAVLTALGSGVGAALVAEGWVATLAFGVPTFAMGALFAQLCAEALARGHSTGRALAFNTLGAAAAPLLVGVGLAPAVGAKGALLAIVAGYLLLALPRPPRIAWTGATAVTAGVAVLAPTLVFVDVPRGGRLAWYREGALAGVSIVEDAAGVATLHINNRQQEGSSATLLADGRQGLLPVLLHPAPKEALFLGIGTGTTATAAALDPELAVRGVELLPEVVAATAEFADAFAASARRPQWIVADARRYVRAAARRFDVIVADNFHPARSGSAALYTREHFAAVRDRLAPGGLFCQWLPLHQLDLETLRVIVATFLQVYPAGAALLATHSLETPVIGLVGRADGAPLAIPALHGRLESSALRPALRAFGIDDELALLGTFIAGPDALHRWTAGSTINTDDRPVVAYRAPHATYAPRSSSRDRLLALTDELHLSPDEVLGAGRDVAWSTRLVAYWAARDRFLAAGRDVEPTEDAARLLAQVREPLLDVLRTSADFRPAYDPLLRMALAVAANDPEEARGLLTELAVLQPARSEAREWLGRLPGLRLPASAAARDPASVTKP